VADRTISRRTLFTIFTLSGFSGLIYESIWSHYLKLFLGHAAYAQTLVLTVFMGGMALGAWLAARWSPKLRNLLLAYALVEAITGAIALGFHPIYLAGTGFTFDTVIPALDSAAAINTAKWVIAALLILPQSILLGTTFPLISGAVVRRFPESPGATLAMLYFTNSLGAALGVLTSGFLLIGWVGLPGTVIVAGIANLLIAVFVWRQRGPEPAPVAAPSPTPAAEITPLTRLILWAAFLSGAAAFVYEIAWIRMLSLVLGSSTHAFELMLSAFILGLAFGGLWIRRRIDSLARPFATLSTMFALMAVLAACTLPLYGYTFELIGAAVRNFPRTDDGYRSFNLVSHGIAALIMVPTTFIAGMTLPVMTHTLLRRADERAIGRVYASNTLGAIAGVLIAVHLLMPGLGLKGTVIAGAVLQLAIAGLFYWRQSEVRELPRMRVIVAGGLALVVAIALFSHLDPMRMASGVYRHGSTRLPDEMQVIYLRDGKTATISLIREGDQISIATNGKPDAAIDVSGKNPTLDEITMTMAAALPLAMHTAPRQIANIGIGSGMTSNVVLSSPLVERLDSIEIEPAMAEGARIGFGARVHRLFEDPRSHIHYEDAKTFFSAGKRRYDVIISEPSNPWVSGVATLFSDEFYEQTVRHLNDGGLLVQWIQIYETDLTIVSSILKAVGKHFEDYVVYCTDNANILIVASPRGTVPPLRNDLMATPSIADEIRKSGLQAMGDLEIRRIGNKRMLAPLMASYLAPMNTDFQPFVDLNAARMRFLGRNAVDLVELQLLPVPYADIFGQPLTHPVSESMASARFLAAHAKALEAKAIMTALDARDPAQAPEEARAWLTDLSMPAAECANDEARKRWLDAVFALSARTTQFLPVAARASLWKSVRSAPCASQLKAEEASWVGLMDASGRGDTAAIAAKGEELFVGSLPAMDGGQLLDALITTATAQAVVGKYEDATALLRAYLPNLDNPGSYALALRAAMAHAELRPK
jgi:predicted membrane-bound spermidine synthase